MQKHACPKFQGKIPSSQSSFSKTKSMKLIESFSLQLLVYSGHAVHVPDLKPQQELTCLSPSRVNVECMVSRLLAICPRWVSK